MQEHCGGKFNSREIQCLYKRFRTLDKRHKGYISEDELMSIPELAISPLAPRVTQVFQNLNFKDFCRVLAAMSAGGVSADACVGIVVWEVRPPPPNTTSRPRRLPHWQHTASTPASTPPARRQHTASTPPAHRQHTHSQ